MLDRGKHLHGIDMRRDIMHPHDRCTVHGADDGRRQRADDTVLWRNTPRGAADGALARHPEQDRATKFIAQSRQIAHGDEALLMRLAETEARIDDDALAL